jgi:UDP-2-acetamido-2-deoxy-ribo-hexuluronate aminotransferase
MRIPFVDLRFRFNRVLQAAPALLKEIEESGVFLDGKWTRELERLVAAEFSRAYGAAVGNATDAATLAIRYLSRGRRGKVLMCAHGFVAQGLACRRNGLPLLLVDMDPVTGQMSESAARNAFAREEIQGLYLAHLHGIPAAAPALAALARKAGAWIVEDFCQSSGAVVGGSGKVGTFGDISFTSIYPTKPLFGASSGAVAVTGDLEAAEYLRSGRLFNLNQAGISADPVMHSRISEMDAAVAVSCLSLYRPMLERRTRMAAAYDGLLNPAFGRLRAAPGDTSAFHHYIVYVRDRTAFVDSLAEAGIGVGCYFPATLDGHFWGGAGAMTAHDIGRAAFHARCNVALPLWEGMEDGRLAEVAGAVNRLAEFAAA